MNEFNKAQVRLVIRVALATLGDIGAIRLDGYFAENPALVMVYVDLLERVLEAKSVKAKHALVASFLDGNGKPHGVTLEQVEAAFAKGKVPPTFVIKDRRLVRIAPFAALQECDLIGQFRAEMVRRATIADTAPDAEADGAEGKKTGTDA